MFKEDLCSAAKELGLENINIDEDFFDEYGLELLRLSQQISSKKWQRKETS